MNQSTNTVFIVRPANFGFNELTAQSNYFQKRINLNVDQIKEQALSEFNNLADILKSSGIEVIIFEDKPTPIKPDAIFPNNWISIHHDGKLILYPMESENRRFERDPAIFKAIIRRFDILERIDFSCFEAQKIYLEGTGSIVFDHLFKIAYACISPRTDAELFKNICRILNYSPLSFNATDRNGKQVYHTNVLMHIGTDYSVVCHDSIQDENEKLKLKQSLSNTGRRIIPISLEQMESFAGNMLELRNKKDEKFTFMSQSAFDSLTNEQINAISEFTTIKSVSVPTIEALGGGSIRCMITEIFARTN